jgi:hypothetical protein
MKNLPLTLVAVVLLGACFWQKTFAREQAPIHRN